MKYFHGTKMRKKQFEGWYFKHQTHEGSLAFIPSLSFDEMGKITVSLQVITEDKSWIFSYPFCEFNSEENQLSIRIGNSFLTERAATMNIQEEGVSIVGRIEYGPLMTMDKSIMGPFRFLPMICNHEVISLTHTLKGSMKVNDKEMVFDEGIGYIEMDWGNSFPQEYLWSHVAWNDESENRIMVAYAKLKVLNIPLEGCLAAILIHNKQVVFSTYFGAKIIEKSRNSITLAQKETTLKLTCVKENPVVLFAPLDGKLKTKIHESLVASVRVELWRNHELKCDTQVSTASFESTIE